MSVPPESKIQEKESLVVKIRLSRMGTKARPFYRMVVANSTEPRGGKFVEILGTYNPVAKPVLMNIKGERALYWLMNGAQPTETAAIVLNKVGVLEQYFSQRPKAKKDYRFLDKRTAAISVKSVMETPVAEPAPKPAPAPEPKPEPEAEAVAAPETTDAPAETPVEAAAAADEAAAETAEATTEATSEPAAEPTAEAEPEAEASPGADTPAEEKAE
jgi:small subunit ribosomal protein S16